MWLTAGMEARRRWKEEQVVQTNYHHHCCVFCDAWWRRKWIKKKITKQMNGNANERFESSFFLYTRSFLQIKLYIHAFNNNIRKRSGEKFRSIQEIRLDPLIVIPSLFLPNEFNLLKATRKGFVLYLYVTCISWFLSTRNTMRGRDK